MPQPLAFLSYTRKDDEFFGGYITAFRKMLENAVHVVSGQETFRIFQDIEGIVIGENWKKKLSEVIHESSFLVPMLSPLFFNSKPCREEVTEFLAHERSLERDDLILPVYFLSSARLEKDEEKDKDPIAKELATRQMFDWRKKANVPLQEPAARDTQRAKEFLSTQGDFAAIISDMGRPGDRNAGLTLLKWLREKPERDTPYFIYTSSGVARRGPGAGEPQPQGITADPDDLVGRVVAALR